MFARTTNNLPADPACPNALPGIAYKVENGQILQVSNSKHFPFHSTNNERANEVHRAMIHECARDEVKAAAAELGLNEIYVIGKDYTTEKPNDQHLSILTTDLDELETKKNVLIVIGEHNQDLGVWAYRHLMNEGGIDGGSVVGLMKALNGLNLENPVAEGAAESPDMRESIEAPTETGPGVIILNPGQLLYSPSLNQCMTQKTWMAREKSSAIGGNYKIDEVHNRIPEHTTPYEHVYTTFEHIIPALISEEEGVRLFIVGIADGAENFIKYFDSKLVEDNTTTVGALVTAMAFMEPTHCADKVVSPPAKTMLHSYGKCWIKSSKPKGTWINAPGAMNPIMSPEELVEMEEERRAKRQKKKNAENEAPGQQIYSDESLAGSQPALIDIPDVKPISATSTPEVPAQEDMPTEIVKFSDINADADDPTVSHPLPPEAYNYGLPRNTAEMDAVMITKSGNEGEGEAEVDISRSSSTDSDSPPGSLKLSRMSTGSHVEHPAEGEGDSPALRKAVLSLKSSDTDSNANKPPTTDSPTSDSPGNLSPQVEESEDGDDAMADSYDYTNNIVSCHTYSGGTDIDEMIWPNVMEDVLDFFFKDVLEKEEKAKRAAAAAAAAGGQCSSEWEGREGNAKRKVRKGSSKTKR